MPQYFGKQHSIEPMEPRQPSREDKNRQVGAAKKAGGWGKGRGTVERFGKVAGKGKKGRPN